MEPRCLREARDCRAPFLETKWGAGGPGELESPEQGSETGTDTGTKGNGLEGSGAGELRTALRNCQENVGNVRPWVRATREHRDSCPRHPLSLPSEPEQTSGFGISLTSGCGTFSPVTSRQLTSSRPLISAILRWEVAGGV